ncbi:MAG: isoleucine--tRNA ligase [Acidobacteria bacterium]|nr:isoleucine--tRNA ligase [Acidobacteriota bacterium]
MSIKDTLNLPRTSFPMKANLPGTEPQILESWEGMGLYGKILEARKGRASFVLHDGPPYANGNIHLGHALNKILKDLVVKTRSMAGSHSPYVPGWDCHGLPIEIKVDQELGKKKAEMSIVQFRRSCRAYAQKYVDLQREEFKRLGVFGDWDRPYLTMSYQYEAAIARALGVFVEQGSVYRGLKPVHWCIHCRTALAEAEVEYEDHESPSIYVKFPVRSDLSELHPALGGRDVSVLIWTTTPWTLPANLAIAFGSEYEYSALEVDGRVYLVATELVQQTAEKCGFRSFQIIAKLPGARLEKYVARHPFIDRDSVLVLSPDVHLDQGTGCVHTAPGHGHEDYLVGQRYGLSIYCPVEDAGRFTGDVEHFAGQQVFEANPAIVELLNQRGMLLAYEKLKHSYPHCWRCHQPVIFRATAQWFISLEKNDLRRRALEEIRKVRWIPPWGEERISNMIANRPDWCISRQRAWGVPIPAFFCKGCRSPLVSKAVVDHVAQIFEREGADAWYERPTSDLIPAGTRCAGCGGTELEKEDDILDVWFDSGSSHYAVLGATSGLPWPSDVYLEGNDQYRGWFHSSLLIGLATHGRSPYREILTHGMTLDAEGRAMSKSLGNVIEPREVIKKDGAEILRLWVSSIDFTEDVRLSEEILSRLREAYRKIRNTCRFLQGNLYDFDPDLDRVPRERMLEIDRWAMARLHRVIKKVREAYQAYQFHVAYHVLYNLCTLDLSAVYLDILKDRLYTAAAASQERRSAQTALYDILLALVRLVAPILPFTAEELWRHLRASGKEISVHLTEFPEYDPGWDDGALLERWERLFAIRAEVFKALESARQNKFVGNSLETRIFLECEPATLAFLKGYRQELRFVFIVSQVELIESADVKTDTGVRVRVEKAKGKKCERCWNYSDRVGESSEYPTLCERCVQVLGSWGVSSISP